MSRRFFGWTIIALTVVAVRAEGQEYGSTLGGKPDPYRPRVGNPQQPAATANPSNLFGGAYEPLGEAPPTVIDPTVGPVPPVANRTPGPEPLSLFEPAKIVAEVGNKHILAGDVAPMVEQILEPYYRKTKTPAERMALDEQKGPLAAQLTRQLIDTKLMYLEFERQIPKDKLPEVEKKVQTSFDKDFSEAQEKVAAAKNQEELQELLRRDPLLIRLAITMKENQAETYAALDAVLRRYQTSLPQQIRAYGENRLGRSIVGKGITMNPEVTHDEMLQYYNEHLADFEFPTKLKWEVISVRKDNFPSRAEAHNALAAMGNEIFFGAPLAAVAQRSSQGWNAEKGGQQDWTLKGTLVSEVLDKALFELPPNKLSAILEDAKAFYIVRVTERQEAGRIPFVDAQDTVRDKIKSQKREKQYKEFVEQLRKKTPVSCIYDSPKIANRPGENERR